MNIKQCYLYFIIASAVSVLLRTLILFFTIDSASGFIKNEYSVIAAVVFILIGVAAVLCFLFCFSSGVNFSSSFPNTLLFKIISVLFGLFLIFDIVLGSAVTQALSILRTLEIISAILAAVSLISYVITDYMKIEFPMMMTVAPVLFWLIRLVSVFITFKSLANIPDNIFELASICLITVASLQLSKSLCIKIDKKASRKNFALYLTTAFVCLTTALPRALVLITGHSTLLHINNLPIISTIAAGLYFLFFAIGSYEEKA